MTDQKNYTPQDILGFGHRAETEGRFAYAHQIYMHLAQYYTQDAVGVAARAGLSRLAAATDQPLPQQQTLQHAAAAQPHQMPYSQQAMPNVVARAQQPRPQGQLPQVRGQQASGHYQPTAQAGAGYSDEPHGDDELADVMLPFRSGMVTMRLAQVLGWLAIAGGVVAIIMEFAFSGVSSAGAGSVAAGDATRAAGQVASGVWVYVVPSGLVVAGIVLVLVSQIARASFEAANAARQLLILERSRAGL